MGDIMKQKIPDNYVKVKDIKTIQKLLRDLLFEFHKICEENNLKYTLDYGTLLGAVRHKDIIPWDDDIDVSMPRPDYDKFVSIVKNNNEYSNVILFDYETKNYVYPYAKLGLKNTILFETNFTPRYSQLALYIDVFPIDGVPTVEKEKSYSLVENQQKKVYEASLRKKVSNVWWKKPYVIFRLLKMIYYRMFGISYFLKKEIDEVLKTDYDTSERVTCRFTTQKWAIIYEMDKSFIEQFRLCDFGDGKFWITSHYNERLSKEYGDYMKLPPVSERVAHHNSILFVDKKLLNC